MAVGDCDMCIYHGTSLVGGLPWFPHNGIVCMMASEQPDKKRIFAT
jgi:hypothetical protein